MTAVDARPRRGTARVAGGLILSVLALLAVCAASVLLGSRTINTAALAQTDLTVILDMRVPRTVLGLLAGAALAVSGTLLQGVARNPLADPGIMGINSGAAVAVVTGILVLGRQATGASVWLAFLGAGAATALVYTIASFGREGATPVKLALAGVVVTAVSSSITSAIVLADADALDELRVWQVGALAGAAGSIFQRVLRNPLAAPDIIGISAGASTATVAGLVLFGAGGLGLSVAGLVGALATATAVYLLAWRGGIADYRFVLIGVGVAALLESVTGYLVSRAEIADARAAMTWLVGSAGIAGTGEIVVLAVGCAVVVPVLMALSRRLGVLELGADGARGLGVRPQADTALQLGCAVVLVALATAAAGPIAFVALMAGPIAGRLLGAAGDRVLASALVGAIIVQTADLLAQHLLPYPISTGIVTGLTGAPYIAWLLIRTDRQGVGA